MHSYTHELTIYTTQTCRANFLHKVTEFLLVSGKVQNVSDVSVRGVAVVPVCYDGHTDTRNLLVQPLNGGRHAATNL